MVSETAEGTMMAMTPEDVRKGRQAGGLVIGAFGACGLGLAVYAFMAGAVFGLLALLALLGGLWAIKVVFSRYEVTVSDEHVRVRRPGPFIRPLDVRFARDEVAGYGAVDGVGDTVILWFIGHDGRRLGPTARLWTPVRKSDVYGILKRYNIKCIGPLKHAQKKAMAAEARRASAQAGGATPGLGS